MVQIRSKFHEVNMENHKAKRFYSTKELGDLLGVTDRTIRASICRNKINGDYYGLCPIRLPNGRLRWPVVDVEAHIEAAKNNSRL